MKRLFAFVSAVRCTCAVVHAEFARCDPWKCGMCCIVACRQHAYCSFEFSRDVYCDANALHGIPCSSHRIIRFTNDSQSTCCSYHVLFISQKHLRAHSAVMGQDLWKLWSSFEFNWTEFSRWCDPLESFSRHSAEEFNLFMQSVHDEQVHGRSPYRDSINGMNNHPKFRY